MEVHHPHHPTHKKKWTEYLLEFFMLFLAVFLGFMAENKREHIVERHREKEYMASLINDLKTDTLNLSGVNFRYDRQIKKIDTLLQLFDSIDNAYNKDFMRFVLYIGGYPDFIYTDATIQQLRNSGSFRLIKNKNAVDSIYAYTSAVSRAFLNTGSLSKTYAEMKTALYGFINYHAINKAAASGLSMDQMQSSKMDFLITHNKEEKERFYGIIYHFQLTMKIILTENFIPLKQKATSLINFLQKEYQLEKK